MGCTYCVCTWFYYYNASGTLVWVNNNPTNIGGGFINCGTNNPNVTGSSSTCFAPGVTMGTLIALYDVPCESVTMSTDWVNYNWQEGVVTNGPGCP